MKTKYHYLVSYQAQTRRKDEGYGHIEITLNRPFSRGDADVVAKHLAEKNPLFRAKDVVITSVFPLEP